MLSSPNSRKEKRDAITPIPKKTTAINMLRALASMIAPSGGRELPCATKEIFLHRTSE
jgi:hypothetical protein